MNNPRLLLAFLGLAFLPLAAFAQNLSPDEERARETLRRTIQERETRPATLTFAETNLPPEAIYALMERRYLDGKITAKQFQRFIRQHKSASVAPAAQVTTNTPELTRAIEILRAHDPKQPNPGPPQNPFGVIPTNDLTQPPNDGFLDLEAKMNDLLRKKNERERSAETNNVAIDPADPAQPMNKRQRLDAILKLLIEGKITDPEYQAKRAKIMTLPE